MLHVGDFVTVKAACYCWRIDLKECTLAHAVDIMMHNHFLDPQIPPDKFYAPACVGDRGGA